MSTVDTRLTPLARAFILICALAVLAAEVWPTNECAPRRAPKVEGCAEPGQLVHTTASGTPSVADAR